jgi:regulatory protein
VRRSPRSRGSASSRADDAYATGLALLGRRELSEAQLRQRLARGGCDPGDIDRAVGRLREERALDEHRAALAVARHEATVRRRGPARVRQKLEALGFGTADVEGTLAAVFAEVDVHELLDAALARRLRGRAAADLDERQRARLVRALVAQGFPLSAVMARMRKGRR